MTELKCPYCNKPLQPTLRRPDEYWCENYDCPQTNIAWVGTSALWQALIDTKKELDISIDGLKDFSIHPDDSVKKYAKKVLKQINKKD